MINVTRYYYTCRSCKRQQIDSSPCLVRCLHCRKPHMQRTGKARIVMGEVTINGTRDDDAAKTIAQALGGILGG
jgi:hypothetical protein